jgi:hypothetical protein
MCLSLAKSDFVALARTEQLAKSAANRRAMPFRRSFQHKPMSCISALLVY